MEIARDISYCNAECDKNCERNLKYHDFKKQIISVMLINPKNNCEFYLEGKENLCNQKNLLEKQKETL